MRIFRFLFLAFLLTACGGSQVVQSPPQLLPTPLPTALELVRTLRPVPSQTPTAQLDTAYPAIATQALVSGTPGYPYPELQDQGDTPGSAGESFRNCTRTPGLVSCDPQGFSLSGRLAIIDRAAARLVVLDLSSGKGWQAPGIFDGLSWSPTGDQLFSWHNGEGGRENMMRSADGAPIQFALGDEILRWQPDGTLAPQNVLRYPDGSEYRLQLVPGIGWDLRIRSAAGETQVLTIDDQPADRQYLLLDRIPGTSAFLAQTYLPTNLGTTAGGGLLVIDTLNSSVQPLGIDAPLQIAANLAWNPAQNGVLAFTASGVEPGATVLSFFNFSNQQFTQPLPKGVQVSSLDWHPDGQRLVFAAEPVPGIISATGNEEFPSAGIFLYDLKTGNVEPAIPFPSGVTAGWVRWSADGKGLLYGRLLRDGDGNVSGEVHFMDLEEQRDLILFNGLKIAQGAQVVDNWQMLISYTR